MGVTHAAGGVVVRAATDGRYEVLVVHRPKYDDWVLPKGKLDSGETFEEAALREVLEESGVTCRPVRELSSIEYTVGDDVTKLVRWWLMHPIGGRAEWRPPDREVDETRWVHVKAARELLTYPHEADIVDEAPRRTIAIIRHAFAGIRGQHDGADADRPLSAVGRRQAAMMPTWLAGIRTDYIHAGPAARCVETVAPLARVRGLKVETNEALTEGHTEPEVMAFLDEVARDRAALCTHGEVIDQIIHGLQQRAVDLGEVVEAEKGSCWLLEVERGDIVRGRYIPPPA